MTEYGEKLVEARAHDWFKYRSLTCCRKCGIVRRRDGGNKPCRGIVHVTLRTEIDARDQARKETGG